MPIGYSGVHGAKIIDLRALLERHEGRRAEAYDDATGATLRPGAVLRGYPTIGVGRNLLGKGLSDGEINYLLDNDIRDCCADLDSFIPWWRDHDPARQAALISWRFNMGAAGFRKCAPTLAVIEARDYEAAAKRILRFKAATQAPARYTEIADMIKSGSMPK